MGLDDLKERYTDDTGDDGFLSDHLDGTADSSIEDEETDDSFLSDHLSTDTEQKGGDRQFTVSHKPEIHFHTSENMEELDDESVELIITSPPYNADWAYGSHDDDKDYAEEYLPMLARVFEECHRVLRPGGRMLVNVPSLLRGGEGGGRPIAADITVMLCEKNSGLMLSMSTPQDNLAKTRIQTEWRVREQIAWVKPFNHDGLAPNGSFPRPWGILLNNMHEVVTVFQKPGDRSYDDMDDERIENSLIDKDSDEMCDDVWRIPPDSWSPVHVDEEDIPVFPEELVRRAIKLWSYEDDTVLDPFAGRFTVGKVAKQENRYSVGYEIREELEQDIEMYAGLNQTSLM